MNNILIKILSTLNGLFALIIIISGALSGFILVHGSFIASLLIGLFGAIIGLFVAAIVCGFIAYLTLIEKHLSIIASQKMVNIDHSEAQLTPSITS